MFKSIASIIGASALVMGSGTAYAIPGHINSPTNPALLEGYASLGSNLCYLKLSATLGDTDSPSTHPPAGWYNVVTNLSGTNDPVLSIGPACPFISVVGGSGTVGSGAINLSSLVIRVAGQPDCEAGPVTVSVTNVPGTPPQINAQVDQSTPCGAITADLFGDGEID